MVLPVDNFGMPAPQPTTGDHARHVSAVEIYSTTPVFFSPCLELPTGDTFGGDDFFEHALIRWLPGQEVSLVQQTPPIHPTVVVVHARRTAEA